ncbi:hypothetical protein CEXT_418061 [Caerostris extrusa]|uniref:Uncharacterized protein n=1 Tax=Caerostris extrusa TaxID=172846 RepID=A0AAV4WEK4_CAEEX|nr:hypothetical protein CEXT_418061 [Caerostris extrusa]
MKIFQIRKLREDIQVGDKTFGAEEIEESNNILAPWEKSNLDGGTFNRWREAAFSESPKAAIALKSTHKAQIILCQKEVVIVQAKLNNQETLLVSVYCPPNKNMDAPPCLP